MSVDDIESRYRTFVIQDMWTIHYKPLMQSIEDIRELVDEVKRLRKENVDLIRANADVANLFVGHVSLLAAAKDILEDERMGNAKRLDGLREAVAACKRDGPK